MAGNHAPVWWVPYAWAALALCFALLYVYNSSLVRRRRAREAAGIADERQRTARAEHMRHELNSFMGNVGGALLEAHAREKQERAEAIRTERALREEQEAEYEAAKAADLARQRVRKEKEREQEEAAEAEELARAMALSIELDKAWRNKARRGSGEQSEHIRTFAVEQDF